VIGSKEVDHLKGEHLGAVVAHVSENDRQTFLPECDGLLGCGLVLSRSQPSPNPLKVSSYMRLRPLPPSMRALVSQVVPTSRSTMR
jgi:hypothetical protein